MCFVDLNHNHGVNTGARKPKMKVTPRKALPVLHVPLPVALQGLPMSLQPSQSQQSPAIQQTPAIDLSSRQMMATEPKLKITPRKISTLQSVPPQQPLQSAVQMLHQMQPPNIAAMQSMPPPQVPTMQQIQVNDTQKPTTSRTSETIKLE